MREKSYPERRTEFFTMINISTDKVQEWIDSIGLSAANLILRVIIAVIIFMIVRKLIAKLCFLLNIHMEKRGTDVSVRSFTISILRFGSMAFTVLTIIVQLNIVKESSIAALIASAGVGVTLALQGGLANLTGGLILLVLKPFRTGDYVIIKSEDVEGVVGKIEMYYTTILTIDNMTVVLPNSKLMNSAVINVTAQKQRRLEIKTGISYDSDIREAKKIIDRIILEDPRLDSAKADIFVDSLGESAVIIGFRAWVNTENYLQAKWDMNERIKLAFDEAGISIPYNQMDVHLVS